MLFSFSAWSCEREARRGSSAEHEPAYHAWREPSAPWPAPAAASFRTRHFDPSSSSPCPELSVTTSTLNERLWQQTLVTVVNGVVSAVCRCDQLVRVEHVLVGFTNMCNSQRI